VFYWAEVFREQGAEMKKSVILCLILAGLVIGCSKKSDEFGLQPGTPAYELAKSLAATLPSLDPDTNKVLVSGKGFEITTGEVIQTYQDNLGSRSEQLKQLPAEQLRKLIEQSAVQLGERKLLLDAAAKANTTVSSEEIDEVLKKEYARAGGEQNFLDWLKSNGVSFDFIKNNIQTNLLINKYIDDEMSSQNTVSEDEIQKAYQEDKTASVRHILLSTEGKSDHEKLEIHKKMEEILAKAKSGEDFGKLARQYSEDDGSKENGGLYENFARGRMVKPFEEAAFSVPVGEISPIVETEFGFHIIKVIDRKKETRPLEEVRPELEAQIKQEKKSWGYQSYLAKLKESAGFSTTPL
jgi:parvulin-like peptidyl-prolyl isomerase